MNIKSLVNKFFRIGSILIILISLKFWYQKDVFMIFVTSEQGLQIYNKVIGLLYNISIILIPIISLILFKIVCDMIYIFLEVDIRKK